MNCLIEPHYLPCTQFFSMAFVYDKIVLDDVSKFRKQSYRNRCRIYGANGVQDLIIAVQSGKTQLQYKDVKIDLSQTHLKQHWFAIRSAYGNAPFFEHYADAFSSIYEKEFVFLLDLNMAFIKAICKGLKISFEEKFVLASQAENLQGFKNLEGLRDIIHPKKISDYKPTKYHQVFEDRHGWQPNLSVIDLLFNEGPASVEILKQF
ncbi:MAG: WbqC family protein [Bacteroidetes bacterium]|nr:WbqC family protein [Bacteroidota bacterium]